jgi:ATP-dependent Clp protease ATP-binding subunit ClpB
VELGLTDTARRHIAETAYDPVYGARPLRRYIQREIETRIARGLLSGEIVDGSQVTVDVGPAGLELHVDTPDRPREPERETATAAA